jgi:hypothetical protein
LCACPLVRSSAHVDEWAPGAVKWSVAKVTITKRALVQRLARALAPKRQRLVGERGRNAGQSWTLVNERGVVREDVDLVALGRELGVLARWERVE